VKYFFHKHNNYVADVIKVEFSLPVEYSGKHNIFLIDFLQVIATIIRQMIEKSLLMHMHN